MKIFFDFNLERQALICHEMAKHWKSRYGISDFAGMVAVKNGKHLEYLKKQKEIKYHFIDNRDEIEEKALRSQLDIRRVEEIEKELDIPLWYFVVADRNIGHSFVKGAVMPESIMMSLANHKNIMKWIVCYYDLISKRLNEFKPDAVIFLANASLPSLMLAKICEVKKIPYYTLASSRMENLYSIVKNNFKGIDDSIIEDYYEIINSEKPEEFLNQYAADHVDSFKNKPKKPDYAEMEHETCRKTARMSVLKIVTEYFLVVAKSALINIVKNNKDINLRRKNRFSNLIFKIRKNNIAKNPTKFFNSDINPEDKYVFFPLHLDPEASTMIFAPNFVNQLQLIEILAKNIPMSHKLYVKEHIPNIGTRPSNFYKEIKKYPNVKLINPWSDPFPLIKNSSLVVTITGTAGWEALLLDVPVVVLAETFYSKAGLAPYCSDMDKLGGIIKKIIYETSADNQNKRMIKVKALVTAIIKNSFKADATGLVWGKGDLQKNKDDLIKVADNFYYKFNQ